MTLGVAAQQCLRQDKEQSRGLIIMGGPRRKAGKLRCRTVGRKEKIELVERLDKK